jgi:hypothetical protein
MFESTEPGMLERVKEAVRPLTEDGHFRFERFEYMEYHGDADVYLSSQNFDIKFHMLLKVHKDVFCFFIVKDGNKFFTADTLFQVFHIDIPLRIKKLDPEIHYESLKVFYRHYQKISEVLLEKTQFIDELSRLCKEIRKVTPELENLFSRENVEETNRIYLEESRKKRSGKLRAD